MEAEKKELLSVAEAADELGVSVARVHKMIKAENPAKRLPAQLIGSVYVIRTADLKPFRERPPGRPRSAKPSKAALARRERRAAGKS